MVVHGVSELLILACDAREVGRICAGTHIVDSLPGFGPLSVCCLCVLSLQARAGEPFKHRLVMSWWGQRSSREEERE